ncbi:MAG: signal peptide peptidase SppA [Lachnospiraceae bacterium]|nr:signal peptide peptidase SppA [Lachnospiraceae bacterium]
MKKKQTAGIVVAAIAIILTGVIGMASNLIKESAQSKMETKNKETLSSIFSSTEENFNLPSKDFVGVIDVTGTIQGSTGTSSVTTTGYNHSKSMKFIEKMMKSSSNKGILLYVDSPGGTVYHSDELYLKLMEYKEKTKRPVYAYFASEACSGGYYISMAADKIYANRNCWTGSIGVIVSFMNLKGLYDKLGIKEIDIASGDNKTMGSMGLDLTDEQRDIMQALVDESYEQFTSIVSEGRNMDIETVKKLADGRIYSALQAKENGLIDEVGSLDEEKKFIEKDLENSDITFYQPKNALNEIFSSLYGSVSDLKKKSDTEIAYDLIEEAKNGELLYYAK